MGTQETAIAKEKRKKDATYPVQVLPVLILNTFVSSLFLVQNLTSAKIGKTPSFAATVVRKNPKGSKPGSASQFNQESP